MDRRLRAGALAVLALLPAAAAAAADTPAPYVVEYYYKARWGQFDEFLRLFKKNHYPLLKREQALGRIAKVEASSPRYHATEDGRWDLRVTITWRDAATANDGFDTAPLVKELFPDREAYDREEQRRFELLLAHWDVPVKDAPLDR